MIFTDIVISDRLNELEYSLRTTCCNSVNNTLSKTNANKAQKPITFIFFKTFLTMKSQMTPSPP